MAVTVVINAVLDIGGRQELGLSDLSGVGADQVAQRQIAALDDTQRRDKLALESSVRRQSCARVASVRITGSLPMSPVPLSVSMVQIAISSVVGTPNCRSMREQRGVALHQEFGALDWGAVTRVAA